MKDWIVAADSTSCLDFIALEHDIETLPLYLHMQGKKLRDVVDISADDFIHWMITHPQELPHSSPPNIKDIDQLYSNWVNRGIKQAILITLSSAISDTYQHAQLAANKYRHRIHIEVFDSRSTLYGQAIFALEAEKQLRKGIPLNAVIAQLEYMRSKSQVYFTVGSVDYLIKNGRLSAAKAVKDKLLKIKPVMHFNDAGEITPVDHVRGLSAAQEQVVSHVSQFIANRNVQMYIMRTLDNSGKQFEASIRAAFPDQELVCLPPSPVIACHTGPELYGLGAYINY